MTAREYSDRDLYGAIKLDGDTVTLDEQQDPDTGAYTKRLAARLPDGRILVQTVIIDADGNESITPTMFDAAEIQALNELTNRS